jgi:hypothetical protein
MIKGEWVMEYTKKPNFRMGEDEDFCAADRIYEGRSVKESGEDFILPDYLPDVKKIVATFPTALIKGRFLGSGTLEYEGEICYRILYVAEDQSLKSVSFLTGFDEKIGNEQFSAECVEMLSPLCENVSVRLLNPRKVNIRSSNGADVAVYKRHCHLPALYGARTADDEEALETKICCFDAVNILNLRENGLTLSEDISFDAAEPSATELIFSRVVPTVKDCRTFEGEVQLRGVADLFCILSAGKTEEGKEEWILLSRSLTFSQTLKNEDLHEGGRCFAKLYVEGADFRLREDEFGQKRVVEFDMTYLCDLTVCYDKQVAVCTDAYSLEKETEKSTGEKRFYKAIAPLKGGFSVNENLTLDLPEDGGYKLVHVFAEPSLKVLPETKNGKAVLKGECGFSLLLRDSAGAPDVRRSTLPLRFVTDLTLPEGGVEGDLSATVSALRCRLDKNLLSCDMEVSFSGMILSEQKAVTVESIRILPEKRKMPGQRGSVILYYPEAGESSFEIAKKYGVPASALTERPEGEESPLLIYCK